MKKIVLSFLLLCQIPVFAQNGLEGIIVEKYYVSDGNDAVADPDGGTLPIGSVTYRIFADMLPGYKFQAVYGVPDHEMRIETSTLFFNNEDRGATSPTYSKTQAARNTVMLDSWLSVGAACTGQFGVLKSEDDGVATIVNTYIPQVLQNADPSIGMPLTQQDGMVAGMPEPVTTVGISSEISVFDNQNDGTNGPSFVTSNGSWASLNGSTGPDPALNKVLIAQITTDGTFSFELNIQIGTPSGGVENYVARNPVNSEIQDSTLIYNSLLAGVSQITNKEQNFFVTYPNPVKDQLTIEVLNQKEESVYYSVYAVTGEEIIQKKRMNTLSAEKVDVSSLAAGMYFLKVQSGKKADVKKFTKQ